MWVVDEPLHLCNIRYKICFTRKELFKGFFCKMAAFGELITVLKRKKFLLVLRLTRKFKKIRSCVKTFIDVASFPATQNAAVASLRSYFHEKHIPIPSYVMAFAAMCIKKALVITSI